MARRKSPKPVTPSTTLRFICMAIRDAEGNAGATINAKVNEFANKMTQSVGEQLSSNQLGIFAANQTLLFKEFYSVFSEKLENILRDGKINWVGDGDATAEALQKCLKKWKVDSTLGEMKSNLINEFDDKIEFVDPVL